MEGPELGQGPVLNPNFLNRLNTWPLCVKSDMDREKKVMTDIINKIIDVLWGQNITLFIVVIDVSCLEFVLTYGWGFYNCQAQPSNLRPKIKLRFALLVFHPPLPQVSAQPSLQMHPQLAMK